MEALKWVAAGAAAGAAVALANQVGFGQSMQGISAAIVFFAVLNMMSGQK
ncbi:MAG: hypothetical protein KDI64_10270 [Candidatus Accumulibacter sp.]|nr:hypothetical protein [Accumulibacter sp.]